MNSTNYIVDEPLKVITTSLENEAATENLAQQLAVLLLQHNKTKNNNNDYSLTFGKGALIYLRGNLGAGKTSFSRAFLRACGVTGRIKSPSYALVESYNVSSYQFYHLDFYRFSESTEWVDAGFRDILQGDNIVLIEWPERAAGMLPAPDLDIHFEYAGLGRQVSLASYSKKGMLWLTNILIKTPS